MPSEPLKKILDLLPLPAFLATEQANIVFANAPLIEAAGKQGDTFCINDLFALGLFANQAEYRAFLDNFSPGSYFQRLLKETALYGGTAEGIFIHATQLHTTDQKQYCFVLTRYYGGDHFGSRKGRGLSQVLDHISHFIFQTDFTSRIVYVNQSFCQVMECETLSDFAAFGGFAKIDLEYSPTVWKQRIEALQRGETVSYESHFQRKDGTILPVEIEVYLTSVAQEKRLTFLAQDISERRRREAELRSALLELDSLKLRLKKEHLFLQQELESEHRFDQIVSHSPAYRPVLKKIEQVANTDSTVLITGETGTGKELIARAIHSNSNRANRPLITVNCAAIPAELIESELFGHKKGAFTGADRNRIGRFELADEGTLFLDEIGEMPLMLQSRLLRVLQEGEFIPIGGKEVVYTNVRVLAATNRDLRKLVERNLFRADLYFRLNVFPIHSIPLRERPEDIPILLEYFIKKYNDKLNRSVRRVRPQDVQRLRQYSFPGNIRELENIVERALILSKGEVMELAWDGVNEINFAPPGQNKKPLPAASEPDRPSSSEDFLSLEDMQKKYILDILRHTNGKVSGPGGAAEVLGLKSQTLFSKLRKLGIRGSNSN